MLTSRQAVAGFLLAILLGCTGAEERKAAHFERGDALLAAGELEKAQLEYKNVVQIDPGDLTALNKLAGVLEQLERWEEAIYTYDRVIALEPQHIAARLRLGRILLAADSTKLALKHIGAALEAAPGNVDGLILRAVVRAKQGDAAGAIEDARGALKRDASRAEVAAFLAATLGRQGAYDDARQVLSSALEFHPADSTLLELLARAQFQQNDFRGAVTSLRKILQRDPSRLQTTRLLTNLQLHTGDLAGAIRTAEAGVRAAPSATPPQLLLVETLGRARSKDEAAARLQHFIAANPKQVELRFALARIHSLAGERERAQRTLREAIEKYGDLPAGLQARHLLAVELARAQDPDGALEQTARVLRHNPHAVQTLLLHSGLSLVKNDPEAAILSLRTLLRDDPKNQAAHKLLARAHVLNNEWEQALDTLQRAIENAPQDVDAHFLLVQLLEQRSDLTRYADLRERTLESAQRTLDERLSGDPNVLDALLARGKVALLRNQPKAARDDFERALIHRPDLPEARQLLARSLAMSGEGNLAEQQLLAGLARGTDDLQLRLEYARFLMSQKRWSEGLEQVRYGLAKSPDNLTLLQLEATLHREQRAWPAMAEAARRLQRRAPDRPIGYYLEGLAAQSQGLLSESIVLLEQALERSPNAVEPLIALAGAYHASAEPHQALEILERALQSAPRNLAALNLKGRVLLALRRYDEAEAVFQIALTVRPQWALPFRQLGHTRMARGDMEGALLAFGQAQQAEPDDIQSRHDLAILYQRLGNRERARSEYEAILERTPRDVIAMNNLAMLLVAGGATQSDLDRALELTDGFDRAPRPELRDTRAWVYLARGNAARALSLLAGVVADRPREPSFRYHLAKAQLLLGDRDAAFANLLIALADPTPFEGRAEAEADFEQLKG